MNELSEEYTEDTYHVSLTDTVYVRIDGRFLIVSQTKPKPPQISTWNEKPINTAQILKQRLYDLQDCVILLLPKSLPRKKAWSKKYPICLDVKELPLSGYFGNSSEVGKEVTFSFDALVPGRFGILDDEEEEDEDEEVQEGNSEAAEETGKLEDLTEEEFEATIKENLATASLELIGELDDEGEEKSNEFRGSDVATNHERVRLYLFGRTGRQKEVWYRHFSRARRYPEVDVEPITKEYLATMQALMSFLPRELSTESLLDQSTMYQGINSIFNRMFFDVRRHPMFTEKMNRIIQKRLDAIKLPSVMEKLELKEFDIGPRAPFIKHVSPPYLNEHGLWVDMQITFNGDVRAKVKTGVNFTNEYESLDENDIAPRTNLTAKDAEIPADNKNGADKIDLDGGAIHRDGSNLLPDAYLRRVSKKASVRFYGRSMKQKVLRFIERFTRSQVFRKFSDSVVMHRAIAQLANTEIILIIEILSFDGILTANIPPPETDRVWYGFRKVPRMKFKVSPWLGEKQFKNALLRRIIEASLRKTIQRQLVLPNMLEIVLPCLIPPDYDAVLQSTIPNEMPEVQETNT